MAAIFPPDTPLEDPELQEALAALTDRQRQFVAHYIANDGNGTHAAELAGYTGDYATLAVTANHTLKLAKVRRVMDLIGQSRQQKARIWARQHDRHAMDMAEIVALWSDWARDESMAMRYRIEATRMLARHYAGGFGSNISVTYNTLVSASETLARELARLRPEELDEAEREAGLLGEGEARVV